MKLLFSHNETPSIIITMEIDDLPIELEVADALKSGHLMMGTAETVSYTHLTLPTNSRV